MLHNPNRDLIVPNGNNEMRSCQLHRPKSDRLYSCIYENILDGSLVRLKNILIPRPIYCNFIQTNNITFRQIKMMFGLSKTDNIL